MNISILDDNKIIVVCVKKMIEDSCINMKISSPNILCFLSPNEFISNLEHNKDIDICFLDIDLKCEINGLLIARKIKEINYHTLLIFMTSYNNYLSEIVQVEPFRFLQKPFQYEDFYSVFVAAYKRISLKQFENECLYRFKKNGIIFSTNLNDVIYISSYKRKIIMLTKANQNIEFYEKLDNVETEIKSLTDIFIRINKSYLFNTRYIENIGKNSITVQGIIYHVSPQYKHNLEIIT